MLTITLRYKLTPEDCNKAYRFALGLDNWLSHYLGIIFFIIFLGSSYTKLPLALSFMFSFYFHYWIAVFQSNRFSQWKIFQAEYETVISPETIEITSEYGSMRMCLSAFHRYRVSKDLIVLYECNEHWWLPRFHIFPRRFFLSEGHFKTFLSYLKANLGNPSHS